MVSETYDEVVYQAATAQHKTEMLAMRQQRVAEARRLCEAAVAVGAALKGRLAPISELRDVDIANEYITLPNFNVGCEYE